MRKQLLVLAFASLSTHLYAQDIGFIYNTACYGEMTNLQDTTSIPDSLIASRGWDLDNDGDFTDAFGTSTGKVFGQAGSIPVGLKHTYTSGGSDTAYFNIYVAPLPQVNFNVDNQCAERDAVFQANATIVQPGYISDWIWDLDNDGIPDKFGDTVTYTIVYPGFYIAKLECVSDQGCRFSTEKTLEFYNNPVAGFTYQNTTTADTTLFTNTTTIDSDSIIIYLWDFGDGVTSTLPDPSHLFENPGTYTVQLEAISSNFCDTIVSKELEIADGGSPEGPVSLVPNNIITPNGDGINDRLEIPDLEQYTYCTLTVFNRWNDQVYSGPADPGESTFTSFDAGVYYYILECAEKELMGSFNLLK
jgi:PKD repeat protein